MIDFTTACSRTSALLAGIRDDDLAAATPCERLSLAQLVAHVGALGPAFAAAARKDFGELTDSPPDDTAFHIEPDWRLRYPANLAALADAWRDPAAWQGMTRIAGQDLPADVVAMIALGEVAIHGWDIGAATGQPYAVDDDVAAAVHGYVAGFAADGPVEGLFDAAVDVGDDATVWQRALAVSGRDPRWRAH